MLGNLPEVYEDLMTIPCQCEDICNWRSGDTWESDIMIIKSFLDGVTVYLNIFGLFMDGRICCDSYGTSIVIYQHE